MTTRWNTAIATQNIRRVLSALDVDLYTHVTDNKEADDIFGAFFKAGVAEIEASTDLALAEVMKPRGVEVRHQIRPRRA